MARRKMDEKDMAGNMSLVKDDIVKYVHKNEVDYIVCNFDTVNYLSQEEGFYKICTNVQKKLKSKWILNI